ncbi:uncharacterized protein LOC130628701 [Hydractinia symbiolongicarpus]|uniref:uncharacterized protein LOC130628701 n=1 Tax=Hydractinia symbiolongicarpus TaxID=13093 RepID=UPI00254AB5D5|nr:uncharacterized protein LOC130628701 [Hydractinia symbiolongicarpus]
MKRIVINKDILQKLCKSLPSPGESSRDNTGQSFFKTNSTPTDFIVHGSDGKKAVEEWDKLCASQSILSSTMQFQEKNEPTQKTSSTSLTEKRWNHNLAVLFAFPVYKSCNKSFYIFSQTLGSSCTITKPKQQKNPIISSEKGQTLGSSGNITKSKFQPPQKQQQKNTISLTEKGSRWQEGDLLILMKEISVRNPFQTKKGSPQRRMAWQDIAENCEKSSITIPVSERVVRERFQIVKDKFLRKMRAEEKGSGITCTYSELEQLMQDLIDLERDCEKEATESKKENTEHDRKKAINIRKRCMERMGDPGKRKKKQG